jgi:ERF superfamily
MSIKHSESMANIGAALSKTQASVKVALKESVNPHLKSKYADLPSIWEACRAALSENNLSVVQLPVSDDPGYIALETMLLHASGEYISARCRVKLQRDDPQGAGSGLTYLRRYALSAALGIVADEDDDAQTATQAAPQAEPAAPLRSISAEAARRLSAQLDSLLPGTPHAALTHPEYAAFVVGRPIRELTDLSTREAAELYTAARTAQKESQAA